MLTNILVFWCLRKLMPLHGDVLRLAITYWLNAQPELCRNHPKITQERSFTYLTRSVETGTLPQASVMVIGQSTPALHGVGS